MHHNRALLKVFGLLRDHLVALHRHVALIRLLLLFVYVRETQLSWCLPALQLLIFLFQVLHSAALCLDVIEQLVLLLFEEHAGSDLVYDLLHDIPLLLNLHL